MEKAGKRGAKLIFAELDLEEMLATKAYFD